MSETTPKLSFIQSLKQTWQVLGRHWPIVLSAWFLRELLCILAAGAAFFIFIDADYGALIAALIAKFLVFLLLQPSFIKLALSLSRSGQASREDLAFDIRTLLTFAAGILLFYVALFAGFLVLVIPALFIFARCSLWAFSVVDGRCNAFESLSESYKQSKSHPWVIMAVVLFAGLIAIFPGLNGYAECVLTIFLAVIYINCVDGGNHAEPDPASAPKSPSLFLILPLIACSVVSSLILFGTLRQFGEIRYIARTAMEPTFHNLDRIILDKVSSMKGKPLSRGDIIVFYELANGEKLSMAPDHLLGRLTGLPFFPNDRALVSRVIALPGEKVYVIPDEGVAINGRLLKEPYVKEAPNYTLAKLDDISKEGNVAGKIYEGNQAEIKVPAGKLFVLSDNRNNSEDSHCLGFIDQQMVIGRFWMQFYPERKFAHLPNYD